MPQEGRNNNSTLERTIARWFEFSRLPNGFYRSKPNAAPPALVRVLDRCSISGSYRRAGEGFVLAEAPSAFSCCDDRRASSVPGYFDMIWRNSCTAPGRSPVLTSVWPFKYIAPRVFGLSGYLSSTALSALSALS